MATTKYQVIPKQNTYIHQNACISTNKLNQKSSKLRVTKLNLN